MNTHKILQLPPEVAAKIKSSTSITHLNGVIVELVKNALDANAHTVFVTVDYRRGGCIVEDDGDGIPPAEFQPEGGLGKAHHTSKFNSETPVYGRRGLFLASLSSLALLTITSHHVRDTSTNTIIFHHSTPVARLTPAPRHQGLKFSDHGSRVTVNDLFGNMPVRVKTRALTLQKPDELDRQWDELKQLLCSLIISNDHLRKLVISDADKERKLTIRPRQGQHVDSELDLTRFGSILAQAGLVDSQTTNLWHAVSATVPQLTICAALSLVPSPSRKAQFISLGIDPVPQSQSNVLYIEVNRLFALSDFGTGTASSFGDDSPLGAQPDGHRSYRPMPKVANKWPMFYICIDTDTAINSDQELPESDKSLQRILDVLGLMINEFLREHNMRPRGGKRKRMQETECPQTTMPRSLKEVPSTEEYQSHLRLPSFSRPGVSPHFGNWSRIKSGTSHSAGTSSLQADLCQPKGLSTGPAAVSPSEAEASESPAQNPENLHDRDRSRDTIIPWRDPYTGVSYWVNSRTGQSVNVQSPAVLDRPRSTGFLRRTQALDNTKRPASAILQKTQNMWVENLLDKWKNPAFSRSEQPINALDTDHDISSSKLCGWDSFGVTRYRGKLRKQDLAVAEVIGQVDRKFILVEMTASLVLIDQHAADERCRVEALFEEFFQSGEYVQTIEVEPIVFDIPGSEASLCKRHAEFFRSWGVEYVVEPGQRSGTASVSVSRLPVLIAERCRTEPVLAIDIIRGEIWKQAEDGVRPQSPAGSKAEQNTDWVGRLAGCPQGILEILNSRACRTAIMFNDVLSTEECRSLVRRLAGCVFPFQCAHGRPSMVPIVDVRGLDRLESEVEDAGFVEAFKRWQSSA